MDQIKHTSPLLSSRKHEISLAKVQKDHNLYGYNPAPRNGIFACHNGKHRQPYNHQAVTAPSGIASTCRYIYTFKSSSTTKKQRISGKIFENPFDKQYSGIYNSFLFRFSWKTTADFPVAIYYQLLAEPLASLIVESFHSIPTYGSLA